MALIWPVPYRFMKVFVAGRVIDVKVAISILFLYWKSAYYIFFIYISWLNRLKTYWFKIFAILLQKVAKLTLSSKKKIQQNGKKSTLLGTGFIGQSELEEYQNTLDIRNLLALVKKLISLFDFCLSNIRTIPIVQGVNITQKCFAFIFLNDLSFHAKVISIEEYCTVSIVFLINF